MVCIGAGHAKTAPDRRAPIPHHGWTQSDRSAVQFMKKLVRQKLADQNELAWRSLYPSHQLIASLESFAECQSGIEIPATRPQVRVLRVSNERIHIAGEPGMFASKAIVVRVIMRIELRQPEVVVVQMLHAVAVGGNWTWILSTDQYDAYSAGICP